MLSNGYSEHFTNFVKSINFKFILTKQSFAMKYFEVENMRKKFFLSCLKEVGMAFTNYIKLIKEYKQVVGYPQLFNLLEHNFDKMGYHNKNDQIVCKLKYVFMNKRF